MTDSNREIAAKLRVQADQEAANAAEDRALADQLDPPKPADPPPSTGPVNPGGTTDPGSPAPAPVEPPTTPSPLPTDAIFTRDEYEAIVKLHPGYRVVAETVLAALPSSYPSGTPGEMTYAEGATGYRDEIGLRAYASQLWAISLDPRAEAHMLANADCSKAFPIHQTQNGDIPKPWIYNDGDALDADLAGNPEIKVDVSHEPSFLFDALMNRGIKKDWPKFEEYLRELKFWVSYNFRQFPGSARSYHKGIFNAVQQRAQAWSLERLAQLTFVLEKFRPSDEWLPWCHSSMEENVRFLDGVYRTGTYDRSGFVPYYDREKDAHVNVAGITCDANLEYGRGADGLTAVIAPWQQGFHSSVICWTYLLDLALDPEVKALHAQLAKWTSRFVVMLFGKPDDPASYDYRRCGAYTMEVGKFRASNGKPANAETPQAIDFFKTPAEFFAPVLAALGALPPDDHDIRDGNDSSPLATRYDDNQVPALTTAVAVGADGATDAFARFKASKQFAKGGSIPFAYLPPGEFYDAQAVEQGGAAPAPTDPVPSTPKPASKIVSFDTSKGTLVAQEPGSYTPTADGPLYWGANVDSDGTSSGIDHKAGSYFLVIQGKAGTAIALDYKVLGDPIPGVAKSLYLPTTAAATPPGANPTPSQPASALPAFVPPHGMFASLPTTNTPEQARAGHESAIPDGYGSNVVYDYAGNAVFYTDLFKVGFQASGHHPNGANMQAELVLDLATRTWAWKTMVPAVNADESGYDAYGRYADGSFAVGHGYRNAQERPSPWGGYPSRLSLSQYANLYVETNPTADAYQGRSFLLNSDGTPKAVDLGGSNYPATTIWRAGQGWFVDTQYPSTNSFTTLIKNDGTIDTTYPRLVDEYQRSVLLLDERHQLLLGVTGGTSNIYGKVRDNFFIRIVDLDGTRNPTKAALQVSVVGEQAEDMSNVTADNGYTNDIEKGCLTWAPERDAAFMLDSYTSDPVQRFLRVTPPPSGDRTTTDWSCDLVDLTHWSSDKTGDATLLPPGMKDATRWVSLVWIEAWDCFLYWPNYSSQPQLIRPPLGGGPDPEPFNESEASQ